MGLSPATILQYYSASHILKNLFPLQPSKMRGYLDKTQKDSGQKYVLILDA